MCTRGRFARPLTTVSRMDGGAISTTRRRLIHPAVQSISRRHPGYGIRCARVDVRTRADRKGESRWSIPRGHETRRTRSAHAISGGSRGRASLVYLRIMSARRKAPDAAASGVEPELVELGGHPGLLMRPVEARSLYVMAHGAGAGMRSELLT